MATFPWLSVILFTPLAGALAVLIYGYFFGSASRRRHHEITRLIALIATVITMLMAGSLYASFLSSDPTYEEEDARAADFDASAAALDEEVQSGGDVEGGIIDLKEAGLDRYRLNESVPWIESMGIDYALAADGLALPLVFLTALLTFVALLFDWNDSESDLRHLHGEEKRNFRPHHMDINNFLAALLLLEFTVIGVFLAQDYFLFFLFWELSLLPLYFLIAIWGGENRKYASLKFFFYTQAASLLVFATLGALIITTSNQIGEMTFSMSVIEGVLRQNPMSENWQILGFLFLFIGFGAKLPTVPFHTWLPDAHVQAPTAGSVMLAGVLLKMGGYGMIRIMLPNFGGGLAADWGDLPGGFFLCLVGGLVFLAGLVYWQPSSPHNQIRGEAVGIGRNLTYAGGAMLLIGFFFLFAVDVTFSSTQELMFVLGTLSMVYGGLVCLGQTDLKKLVAYSSVAHMGAVTLGIATMHPLGISGAIFMMFAHGLISPAMFMLAGHTKHALHTRTITEMGGLVAKMPYYGWIMVMIFMASVGVPLMAGFVAEFIVFVALYRTFGMIFLLPVLGMLFTAAYHLWAMQRAIFGPVGEQWQGKELHDLSTNQIVALGILMVFIVLYGILPFLLMSLVDPFSTTLVAGILGGA